jgi:hypothetical protein
VLPLGLVACASTYWLSLASDAPWVFPVLLGAVDLSLLRGGLRLAPGPPLRGALPPFAVLLLCLAATQFPMNRFGPRGEFLRDPSESIDTAFHVGLTWELTAGYPPQVPGLAGVRLGYHFAPHLVRAAAVRWAGVHPYDLLNRFDPVLGGLALVLALRGITRAIGGSPAAVAVAPWTLLATDLSFVFAGRTRWWTELLDGNLLLPLFFANTVVPALALLLGALVALSRFQAGEGRGWLALAALLGAALPFFKVFLAAQLLGAAALAAPVARPRGPLLALALPCLLATVVLAAGPGGETIVAALDPLTPVREARSVLGLPSASGAALAAWAALWLIASLGLRILGLPAALRALRAGGPVAAALAALALSGWPLGLLFRIGYAGETDYNEAVYFVLQSGPLLWVFAALALAGLAARAGALAAAALALALAAPSTVEFLVRKATTAPDVVPPVVVQAMRALERDTRPGEVVLERPAAHWPPLPVVLAGRRVPYTRYIPYMAQFAARRDYLSRSRAIRAFFATEDAAEAEAIARSLGATFLVLYGDETVVFDPAPVILPVFHAPDARVYRFLYAKDGP